MSNKEDLRKKTIPIYRIAVLGARGVGKTSIINSFVNNQFDPYYEETESDIRKYKRIYDINRNPMDPQYVIYQIEDIFPIDHEDLETGADPTKNQIYYSFLENKPIRSQAKQNQNILQVQKQIYGYVFVFDATNHKSYDSIVQVIKYISDFCELKNKFSEFITKKILIANKTGFLQIYDRIMGQFDQIDLLDETQRNSIFDLSKKKFIEEYKLIKFFNPVSAKNSTNVGQIFEELGKNILQESKIEMMERDWFGLNYNDIEQIDQTKQNEFKEKQQNANGQYPMAKKEQKNNDYDEEFIGYDLEDEDFANIPFYDQEIYEQDTENGDDGCLLF